MANGSKYYDSAAAIQVIGCTLQNQHLLDDEGKYFYNEEDFVSDFHKKVFGAIYNLHTTGASNITTKDLENYLMNHDEARAVYNAGKGSEWVINTRDNADLANFDYYYSRLKKMTLLRAYEAIGMDMSFIYNPDELFDVEKKSKQEDAFNALTLNGLHDIIEDKITRIKMEYVDNATDEAERIGSSIFETLAMLEVEPDMGIPLYGRYINSITRGARLGKFYIRSAPTGIGKTRSMIADACYIACNEIYIDGEWRSTGKMNPTLYISTELDMTEVQTMALAFLSGVSEANILKNDYMVGEKERVLKAANILEKCPLFVEIIPDFSLKDIENIIKRNIRVNSTQYVFYDYLHTSMKILEEVSRRSGGVKLREDNILFLLSVKLKDICTQYNVFILTSTQLSAEWKKEPIPDQNMLRGI